MNFQESIDYLYGLQLFGIKLGLENMQALKGRLPLLQEPLPCIHVAGTNGKGSVSVMLAEILRHSGLNVGLYTSPHLHCFSERIRINGAPVSRDEINHLTEVVREAAADRPVTFFEATTAMALLCFKEHRVDVAVVETGLGGRLDATNIVDPLLCLITPISLDHSEHLGESLAEIAAEKAGILKKGVPVVVGRQAPEVAEVIQRVAESKNVPVVSAGQDYSWRGQHDNFAVAVDGLEINGLSCRLAGEHQLDNFAHAVAAAISLRRQGFEIPDQAIRNTGQCVAWPGRLEWVGDDRKVLLDVSHNRAGIECLAAYLQEEKISRIHLVAGLSGVRDPAHVFKPLEKIIAAVYAVPVSYGKTVPVHLVAEWASGRGIADQEYLTADAGLSAALAKSSASEPVVICGSLYLVAELRAKLLEGESVA